MDAQIQPVQHGWLSYAIPVVIFGVAMFFRLRSMNRVRPLKLETLWVVPALYLVLAVLMFVQLPPVGWVAAASAVGLFIGAAVGWQRGKMMRIHVDPGTHALNQKASPAAMLVLVALILLRTAARSLDSHGAVDPAMLTDPLIAFALGMFTLTRVEMYVRARRLLEEARGRA